MVLPSKNKFSDPRWHSRRDEILETANSKCVDCDSYDDVQVHICFGDKDTDPWNWPDEAFRCLCHEHRQQRQLLEKDIRKAIAQIPTPELDPLANTLEVLVQIKSDRMAAVHSLYALAKRRSPPSMDPFE